MKKLLVVLGILLFISCGSENENRTGNTKTEHIKNNYKVVVIDSCQYIVTTIKPVGYAGYGFMAHKGNCNNPYHKDNQ